MAETKKKAVAKKPEVDKLNEVWDVINEMQEKLNFINDNLKRVMNRMGL